MIHARRNNICFFSKSDLIVLHKNLTNHLLFFLELFLRNFEIKWLID